MQAASRSSAREESLLSNLAVAAGLGWSLAFVIVALVYELQIYADGAMFSYAVAVQDALAFHWHNIAHRISVFFLTLWPAETYVSLTGHPYGGIVVYGLLFNVAPLIGLAWTFIADRSRNRAIFVFACGSTALLCPLVFGFPTEMWIAHALFWPALALAHYARPGIRGAAALSIAMSALPPKPTFIGASGMSALCQKRTLPRSLDDLVGPRECSRAERLIRPLGTRG